MTPELPTLLAVLAHPDDETFGMGGTLALYARRGVAVHLVCATRGEAGEADPELMAGFETVADLRVHELRCAAEILRLAEVHFLDYRDSGMPGSPDNERPEALAAAPVEEVAAKVAGYIRRIRPQVVVTFDPLGGYLHPDHVACHQATVRAFELAADESFDSDEVAGLPPWGADKLYYSVFPKGLLRFAVRALPLFGQDPHRFGRNGDIDLIKLVEGGDFPIHAAIDITPVQAEREDATYCHASQLGGGGMPRRGPLNWILRWFNRREYFMRAYPPAEDGPREDDLFAGL
jgi:LmbE family N-acetylglucosaminyl deacetylase